MFQAQARVITAALGALILSTSFVAAAIAPAIGVSTQGGPSAYAQAEAAGTVVANG